MTLQLTVNGTVHSVTEEQRDWSLLEFLRNVCGLISPKDGCAPQGQCGACVVRVGKAARVGCATKVDKVLGQEVLTLEGVPAVEREILGRSFAITGAVQCGFCIPGLVMRSKVLLDGKPEATRDELARGIDLHICRCTGYVKILDAIELARDHWAAKAVPELPPETGIGARAPRYEGADLALGDRRYVADMHVDGLLHGALVFSPAPRALIRRIDTAPAEQAPGVVRVLTARDVHGQRWQGLLYRDWPIFVGENETTYYIGNALALVLGETEREARAAAALVRLEYDELPGVFDVDQALAPDAPRVHPKGNLLAHSVMKRGDVLAAEQASAHLAEGTYQTQFIEHAFMEPEASVAIPAADGSLDVYSQGQGVFDDRRQIASILVEPEDRVRVHLVSAGGAFGGKEDLSVQGHAALAARLLGRPVKLVLTRDESIRTHPKRHPIRMHYRVGCDAEGHLTFANVRLIGDTGAHASVGTKVLERALGHATSAYRIENVDIEALTVYTNNPPCGAMRGFGANQANFAFESLLDELAAKVGIDGWDIRWRNALEDGDTICTGQKLHSVGLKHTLLAVKEDYKAATYAGIACGIKNVGIGNGMPDIGRAELQFGTGGHVEVFLGHTEMGQGLFTIARQIVCEELGLAPEHVSVRTSTEREVNCGMTTASRGTVLAGNALFDACAKVKTHLAERGVARVAELEGESFFGEYICDFTNRVEDDVPDPITHMSFGFATQVAILDDAGVITRFIAAHDVGRVMNRTLCEGQLEGSIHMGLGFALTEELALERGRPVDATMRGLGLIRARNMPEVDVRLIEVPEKNSKYGSKGVGEIGLVPTAGAVANALFKFDGVRRTTLPMKDTPAARAALGKRA
jgi:selenium-dependent xanthine dehydrogenase